MAQLHDLYSSTNNIVNDSDYRQVLDWWLDLLDSCVLIQLVTTIDYSAIADSHTLQFTTARTKSSQSAVSSLGTAWQRLLSFCVQRLPPLLAGVYHSNDNCSLGLSYIACTDHIEHTISSSSSLLHYVTAPTEMLFTQPLHSNGLLFSSVIACLLWHNLATDSSFCLTRHNIKMTKSKGATHSQGSWGSSKDWEWTDNDSHYWQLGFCDVSSTHGTLYELMTLRTIKQVVHHY
jgi:hypothetical protein